MFLAFMNLSWTFVRMSLCNPAWYSEAFNPIPLKLLHTVSVCFGYSISLPRYNALGMEIKGFYLVSLNVDNRRSTSPPQKVF